MTTRVVRFVQLGFPPSPVAKNKEQQGPRKTEYSIYHDNHSVYTSPGTRKRVDLWVTHFRPISSNGYHEGFLLKCSILD
jgi:hypothetical protein